MYNQNKTFYNINIKHIIKFSIFATFQQPYLIKMRFYLMRTIRVMQWGENIDKLSRNEALKHIYPTMTPIFTPICESI